jgi:hypothetical protein
MRLINVNTLRLEEFYSGIPLYAILSPCWGEEEATFKDWQASPSAQNKKGFSKIERACKEAQAQGYDYLWCDTNCIDKTSSAELSEAINSMFDWYGGSSICLAYLDDISRQTVGNSFRASRWFTRGWTLQELLAPEEVRFYDKDWQFIGLRSTLADDMARATGIDTTFLRPNFASFPFLLTLPSPHSVQLRQKLNVTSVATCMSWLSRRKTTRVEDIAYCMLGIFDINMPLLYGEGMKAFQRLQEEIIRMTNDMTIFCWHGNDITLHDNWESILAPSPAVFATSGGYRERIDTKQIESIPFSITNAGLSVKLPVVSTGSLVLALLPEVSHTEHPNSSTRFALPFQHPSHLAADVHVRDPWLPPLALPVYSDLGMVDTRHCLTVGGLARQSMLIPSRQAHLRAAKSSLAYWRYNERWVHAWDVDYTAAVLVILTTPLQAVLDKTVAPRNMLKLEYDYKSGQSLGVLPVDLPRHNITLQLSFSASTLRLSDGERGKRQFRAKLCLTGYDAENERENLTIQRVNMSQWFVSKRNASLGIGGLGAVSIRVATSLGESVAVKKDSELAVAHVAIHHEVPDEDETCRLCRGHDGDEESE